MSLPRATNSHGLTKKAFCAGIAPKAVRENVSPGPKEGLRCENGLPIGHMRNHESRCGAHQDPEQSTRKAQLHGFQQDRFMNPSGMRFSAFRSLRLGVCLESTRLNFARLHPLESISTRRVLRIRILRLTNFDLVCKVLYLL